MLPDLPTLIPMIRAIVREEILPRFNRVSFSVKQDGSLLTEADLATDQRIRQFLSQQWSDIPLLSEEMTSAEQQALLAKGGYLWCLDPLDGTSNFAAGVPLFATGLALFKDGEVVLSLSYDPTRDEMFAAEKGKGAWLNGQRLQCSGKDFSLARSIALVDFKRLPMSLVAALTQQKPYASQRNLGSCVLEWVWMAASRGQLYLHVGMKLWDMAAGSLLLREAGGFACALDGSGVFHADLNMRSAVASPDEALFHEWFDYIQQHLYRA